MLEQYFYYYIKYKQDNWVILLPIAQFTYNSGKNAIIGITPFYTNYGYELTISYKALVSKQIIQEAIKTVEKLKNLQKQLAKNIEFISV